VQKYSAVPPAHCRDFQRRVGDFVSKYACFGLAESDRATAHDGEHPEQAATTAALGGSFNSKANGRLTIRSPS
jgi:hypothetical protein